MTQEEYWQNQLRVLEQAKEFVDTTDILLSVFNGGFFDRVEKQLKSLQKDRAGLIHPIYNLIIREDFGNNFAKLKLLENNLKTVLEHQDTRKADANDIKGQLRSFDQMQSLDTLYEISVLGHLLMHLNQDSVNLFPRTQGKKNVDAKIILIDRPVYFDITALGASQYQQGVGEMDVETTTGAKASFNKFGYTERIKKNGVKIEGKRASISCWPTKCSSPLYFRRLAIPLTMGK